MGNYQIQLGDSKVKVTAIDNPCLLDTKLEDFKTSLQKQRHRVVGFNFCLDGSRNFWFSNPWLLLCHATHCLMFRSETTSCLTLSESLDDLFADESICFVGVGIGEAIAEAEAYRLGLSLGCTSGVELGYLAARVLKKPSVAGFGLRELGCEVGVEMSKPVDEDGKEIEVRWSAKLFSPEEIKYAVHDAFYFQAVANKLFDML